PGLRRSFILTLAVAALAQATAAWAWDENQVKAGLEVWKSAGCADCHGPYADGDKQRDEMPTGGTRPVKATGFGGSGRSLRQPLRRGFAFANSKAGDRRSAWLNGRAGARAHRRAKPA